MGKPVTCEKRTTDCAMNQRLRVIPAGLRRRRKLFAGLGVPAISCGVSSGLQSLAGPSSTAMQPFTGCRHLHKCRHAEIREARPSVSCVGRTDRGPVPMRCAWLSSLKAGDDPLERRGSRDSGPTARGVLKRPAAADRSLEPTQSIRHMTLLQHLHTRRRSPKHL
jgi:hypothetical protein